MGSTADKLQQLIQTKIDIKDAIEGKGVSVGAVPFSVYPEKINEISGSSTDLIKEGEYISERALTYIDLENIGTEEGIRDAVKGKTFYFNPGTKQIEFTDRDEGMFQMVYIGGDGSQNVIYGFKLIGELHEMFGAPLEYLDKNVILLMINIVSEPRWDDATLIYSDIDGWLSDTFDIPNDIMAFQMGGLQSTDLTWGIDDIIIGENVYSQAIVVGKENTKMVLLTNEVVDMDSPAQIWSIPRIKYFNNTVEAQTYSLNNPNIICISLEQL